MTSTQGGSRPAKRTLHSDPRIDMEFRDVYHHLRKVDLGPFRFIYDDENDALYLQVKEKNLKYYTSVLKINRDGDLSYTGATHKNATLENPGRG